VKQCLHAFESSGPHEWFPILWQEKERDMLFAKLQEAVSTMYVAFLPSPFPFGCLGAGVCVMCVCVRACVRVLYLLVGFSKGLDVMNTL
jgi:hypothetical protein